MSEAPAFQYYEGFFSFYNEQVEVLMDEATFEQYIHAYFVQHGIDTRSEAELLEAATKAQQQRKEVENIVMNPDYWFAHAADPRIRIIKRDKREEKKQERS